MRISLVLCVSFALAAAVLWGCISAQQSYARIPPGMWRGVLALEKFQIPAKDKEEVVLVHEDIKPGQLPFNFEVKYLDDERFVVEIINGDERIRCDSIQYGRDRSQARDTLNIHFPEYQSYIHAEVRGAFMKGEWVVTTKENYRIPFTAQAGQAFRFTSLTEAPVGDLSGEWAALFDIASDEPYKAIGEFKQQQNRLTGTFRTETGDYRYLEGTVQGRKFWLSCFDGTHAFLFSGSMRGDSLQGEFRSGKSAGELWTAWRDPNFRLGAADSLVTLKAGVAGITFRDTTPEGRILAFPGPDYAGKVKIFTILGTWCPNCRDEQLFLSEYLRRHPEQAAQMAVVGFAFERHKTAAEANAHLSAYKQKLGIPFDIVHAGKNNKDVAAAYFPSLSRVMAFPTMIVLDKRNQVRRIHTGFDGPATSKYAEFEQEFGRLIGALIEEK